MDGGRSDVSRRLCVSRPALCFTDSMEIARIQLDCEYGGLGCLHRGVTTVIRSEARPGPSGFSAPASSLSFTSS